MKKIVLGCMVAMTLFAKVESDVALTIGYNNFSDDDEHLLFDDTAFYGVRGGIYPTENIGFQLGYEQTNKANCEGLLLQRYYTNIVAQKNIGDGLTPYAVGTLGYETSSKEYRPSQAFVGLGGGLKYNINNRTNVFLETRALKSLKSHNIAYSATLGVGYRFDTAPMIKDDQTYVPVKKVTSRVIRKIEPVYLPSEPQSVIKKARLNRVITSKPVMQTTPSRGQYFVQVEALTISSPVPMLQKLKQHGFYNGMAKRLHRGDAAYTAVVVGPYRSRAAASKALIKLKSVSPGAYIKKL